MAAPRAQTDVMLEHLTLLYGQVEDPYRALLWRLPPRASLWFSDPQAALPWAEKAVEGGANVYCGVGLCDADHGQKQRTSYENVKGLVGLVADVDFAKPGAKKQYAKGQDEAMAVLLGTGLHPTIIVHSGNGLQGWWLFREPWLFDEDEREQAFALCQGWGETLKLVAERQGVTVDSVWDPARVLRLAGSLNVKDPAQPLPVTLTFADDARRYNPGDMDDALLVAPEPRAGGRAQRAVLAPVGNGPATPFPWTQHEALCQSSAEYKAAWDRTRDDQKDVSASGWDMTLANMLVVSGLQDDQIAVVLVAARQRHGDRPKDQRYYETTIGKARDGTGPDGVPLENDRDEAIEQIANALRMPLTNIQRVTGTSPVYRFTVEDSGRSRSAEIPASKLLNQETFRATMFALTDIPPRKVGAKERPGWDHFVRQIALAAEELDAGSDATSDGELLALLGEFFAANTPVELAEGNLVEHAAHPFLRGGRVWFRATTFLKYCTMGLGQRMMEKSPTIQRLTVMGAERKTWPVRKGEGRSTGSFYGVPARLFEGEGEGGGGAE